MPIRISQKEGGEGYGNPFIKLFASTHVKVDISQLTTDQVDELGVLKPGVILPRHGGALGNLSGVAQVETATVAGTIGASGGGNIKVTVISKYFPDGHDVIVAVANDDTAAQIAGKIRTALGADAAVIKYYTVGGSSTTYVLTARSADQNDSTLVLKHVNDTSSGMTNSTTSANTTAGVAPDEAVMVIEATQIADDNTALSSITNDPFIGCATIAEVNRMIVEDNLGRKLLPAELAAIRASKLSMTLA
ncbi:MAG TPA: hypothetical protein PKY82_02040 [Pyrinomonadaceae bacterium]|nr:hypothetical protein [Pyrinomonadaceae bacterium]